MAGVSVAPPATPAAPLLVAPSAPVPATPASAPRVASMEIEVEERWLGVTAALVMASYTGVLSRIGLTKLNDLQLGASSGGQSYVFSTIYAEIVGCVLMGAILPHRSALQAWSFTATVAAATGLTGSVTTFSSWQAAAMEAAVNFSFQTPSSPAGQFVAWVSIQMLGLAVSMGALVVGTHLGALCAPLVPRLPSAPTPPAAVAPSAALQASHRPSRWSSWILVENGSAGGSLSDVDADPTAAAAGLAGESDGDAAEPAASAGQFAPAEDDGAGNIELRAKAASEAPTLTTTESTAPTKTAASPTSAAAEPHGPPARKPSTAANTLPPSVTIKVVHPTGSPWAVLSKRERMSVVTALLVTAMLVAIAVTVPASQTIVVAMLFGPPGTLLRWKLAAWNSNRFGFPFGTLTANVVGSCIFAAATLLLQGTAPDAGPGACAVVGAITNGFAGCLTTVSTFAVELHTLPRKRTYQYWAASVGLTTALLLIIYGAFVWTYPAGQTPAQCT